MAPAKPALETPSFALLAGFQAIGRRSGGRSPRISN
jgi:hypothetical protein